MLFTMTNKYGSRREIKNNKKIKAKSFKFCIYSSSNNMINDSNCYSPLSSYSNREEIRQPTELKYINK